jgi:hypothetical protein
MMKRTLYLAALLGLAAVPAKADLYHVAVASWVAGGQGTKSVAFQNVSTSQTVEIVRIEVAQATEGIAITGGLMRFNVYGSTAMTHGGTAQTNHYSLRSVNTDFPSAVSLSTGPVSVTYEKGKTTADAVPIIRPLFVNNDETATANFADYWQAENSLHNIILPAGANRGVVLEQRNVNATSVTAGVLLARIVYILK